jgi:uncharacterized repeat protein (TIGR04138 family)
MDEKPPRIEADLHCHNCGYNLRTLAVDQLCPECGGRIAETLKFLHPTARGEMREWIWDALHAVKRIRYEPIAKAAGCTVDAVKFVFDALRASRWKAGVHRSAAEVCGHVRAYVEKYFDDPAEAKELLGEWGIRRSEDVGRIICAAVELRLLKAQPHESVRDFDGLFVL